VNPEPSPMAARGEQHRTISISTRTVASQTEPVSSDLGFLLGIGHSKHPPLLPPK
jgi:hypothetical protein